MTTQELDESRERLERFAEEMLEPLHHRKQRVWGAVYARGLLMEGRRKSVQPMAQRLPDGDMQSLQQFVGQSPWNSEPVRARIAHKLTAALGGGGAWIVDDTGFPKQGAHSVGVARQYSGTLGKTGNCQVGVNVSYATDKGAMPLDWALYLPESWVQDSARRQEAGIPPQIQFQTKWELALGLMDTLLAWELPRPQVVVADAGYGNITEFRQGLAQRRLPYVVGVESTLVAWRTPQQRDAPVRQEGQRGRPRVAKYRAERPGPRA
jgi:SRSO17 transposase